MSLWALLSRFGLTSKPDQDVSAIYVEFKHLRISEFFNDIGGGLKGSTQHFIVAGEDGVWIDGSEKPQRVQYSGREV